MDNSGNQKRVRFYKQAWEIFLEHPFLGGGYDQFKYLSGTGGYAHSTYAEAIADFGFVGCTIYFIPILYASYQILKKALLTERSFASLLMAALCIAELFLGAGQIFFMEFYHFLAWSILFFYSREVNSEGQRIQEKEALTDSKCKYIRNL